MKSRNQSLSSLCIVSTVLLSLASGAIAQGLQRIPTTLPLIFIERQESNAPRATGALAQIYPPALTNPSDSAQNVSYFPVFNWTRAMGTYGWRAQLTTSPTFDSTVSFVFDTTVASVDDPAVTAPRLQPSTTYFWRVRTIGYDSAYSEWSRPRSFTTARDITADAIVLIEPQPGTKYVYDADQPTITQDFKWHAVPGATEYVVPNLKPKDIITDTFFTLTFSPPYASPMAQFSFAIYPSNASGVGAPVVARFEIDKQASGVVSRTDNSGLWLSYGNRLELHYALDATSRLRLDAIDVLGRVERILDAAIPSSGSIEIPRASIRPVMYRAQTDRGSWLLRP